MAAHRKGVIIRAILASSLYANSSRPKPDRAMRSTKENPMKPERWLQIDQLLEAALEREPEERAAFLADACAGDESLRLEVESLLRSDEATESFDALGELQVWPLAGQRIGHYEILSRLGAGGMGEVYLAEDTKLGRKIALKLLPAEFTRDDGRVRRFAQE